jgi:hypothetical protein
VWFRVPAAELLHVKWLRCRRSACVTVSSAASLRLPAVGTLKGYSKTLEYEYRVKILHWVL